MSGTYPVYDFRSLLGNKSATYDDLILSLSREPLTEILRSWKYLNNIELYKLFNDGIYYGISNNRYSAKDMKLILDFPEFYKSSLDALYILWSNLYSYDKNDKIYLSSFKETKYKPIYLPNEDKQKLLKNDLFESSVAVNEIKKVIKRLELKV